MNLNVKHKIMRLNWIRLLLLLSRFCHWLYWKLQFGAQPWNKERREESRKKLPSNPSNMSKMMIMFSISISRSCLFIYLFWLHVGFRVVCVRGQNAVVVKLNLMMRCETWQSCKRKCDKRKAKILIGKVTFCEYARQRSVRNRCSNGHKLFLNKAICACRKVKRFRKWFCTIDT